MRIVILLLFISNLTFAQYWGGQEINESDLSPWVPKFITEYEGTYHFGESEGETQFNLFFSEDLIVGQVKTGYWIENTQIWRNEVINFTNIKIDKEGKLTSDEYTGQFITFQSETGENYKGLKIDNPWSGWIENSTFEIGTWAKIPFKNFYYGKYGKASFRKLATSELKEISPEELTIMKNEIYARYGYIFIEDEKMDKYFRNQDWYRKENKDVSSFLTEIERYNIKVITEWE